MEQMVTGYFGVNYQEFTCQPNSGDSVSSALDPLMLRCSDPTDSFLPSPITFPWPAVLSCLPDTCGQGRKMANCGKLRSITLWTLLGDFWSRAKDEKCGPVRAVRFGERHTKRGEQTILDKMKCSILTGQKNEYGMGKDEGTQSGILFRCMAGKAR